MGAFSSFKTKEVFNAAVIVAALGYFVDVYDLILFAMVRIKSLTDIGINKVDIDKVGIYLHNCQFWGMMLGGIFWGILGDKKGRLSVLFASILTYSIANIANGFVDSVNAYAFWRFIAGFGLAGELGVGITLVSEGMSKENRGYGTMLVASIGVTGAVAAAILTKYCEWRTVYFIGGGLGLLLLVLRIKVVESGIFKNMNESDSSKGNFFQLFSGYNIFSKYIKCIMIGIPIWYVIGFLIMYVSKFLKFTNMSQSMNVDVPSTIMYYYIGLTVGDILSGVLSQYLQSRKKAVLVFILLTLFFTIVYFVAPIQNIVLFYSLCILLGMSCGYWAVFITISAEQFGTNIRSTVANTAPNFVRGMFVVMGLVLDLLIKLLPSTMTYEPILIVGALTFIIALVSLYYLDETFNRDMDYLEV
ncbi:MAG: transporter [Bacteroidota bacterium]|jgi:putative MFS transporter